MLPNPKLPRLTDPHLLDVSMFWGASGGVRRVLSTKHERLRALGWRHTILAPGAEGGGHVDCGGLPLPGSGGYRLVLGRGRALRQMCFIAPDLIESADPYVLAWASLAAAERLKVPAVACCHSNLPELASRLGQVAERAARRYLVQLYRHFDLVMAPSRGMAQRLQAWGVPRVTLQPLGVDCSVFHPCARDADWRAEFCREQGLDPATRLLIYTGRFAPEKHLQLLADAVHLLGRGHVLVAVGDGPAPPVGEQVRLLPTETDSRRLARMVASCDAYVHAGDQETFGLGVLEAMACGTPVVVAGSAGLAELAADAGLLVDRPRAGSWAEAMEASLQDSHPLLRRTALARAQAHDWPRVLEQMTRRYATLITRPSASAQPPLATPRPAPRVRPWAGQLARQR
jgi:alpha-1,6-mannosyltransferase